MTQHVVAEAFGLRARLGLFRHRRELVWQAALGLLSQPGIEEHPVRVTELAESPDYRRLLQEIGPVDAGLIYTAERRGAVILSEDGPLQHWAGARSVEVKSLNQIGAP